MKDILGEKLNMDWILDDTNELLIFLGNIKVITEKIGLIFLGWSHFFKTCPGS